MEYIVNIKSAFEQHLLGLSRLILSYDLDFKVYAIVRSSLALSLLIVLILDNINLFDPEFTSLSGISPLMPFSIFEMTGLLSPKYLILISCIVLFLVVIGVYPRITGILHLWIVFSFNMSATILEGGDQVHQMMAIFLLPITLFDPRLSHWHYKNIKCTSNVYVKCFLLIVVFMGLIQISFIYLVASISKLNEPFWQSGTALYYILNNPVFGTYDFVLDILRPIMENPIGISIMTYSAVAVEFTIGISLYISKSRIMRNTLFALGVMFHIFIGVFMGLTCFSLVMISSLLFYFYILKKN